MPAPKLVATPESLPNECFGDVAMVTEFIANYAGLLMPDDEYPIYTDALMKAVATGKDGFVYLSRVLTVLLQTLLQDRIAEVNLTHLSGYALFAKVPYMCHVTRKPVFGVCDQV